MSKSSHDQLLQLFQVEASEHLGTMNRLLLQLETENDLDEKSQHEILRELFRSAHSLKGAARSVSKTNIERVAHAIEDVFASVQEEKLALDPNVADILYDGLDGIERLLKEENPEFDLAAVVAALEGLTGEKSTPPSKLSPSDPHKTQTLPASSELSTRDLQRTTAEHNLDYSAPVTEETIRVSLSRLEDLMTETGNLLVSHINIEQRLEQVKDLHRAHHLWQRQWRRVHTEYIRLLRTTSQNSELLALWQPMLDFLQESQQYMKRAGREFQQLERSMNEDSLALGLVTDTIQSGVRDMRLLPFESITGGLQRMVRDMARDLDKEVLFQTVGAHIELDKHVLENLKDPLNHLLRNAIDHGIETAAEREAAGKYPKGMILVALTRRGNAVSLTLSDDGRGIDHEQVRHKALQRGLISPNEARTLTDSDIYDLLMQPGVSTSPAVNEISGRGIGLDVVRQKVEALQGQLSIQSQLGEGTTFEIVLPVSLSTLHCILVRIGEETYAVPSNTVIRVFNYDTEQVFSARGRNMLTYGGRPVPLSVLADVLERHHISYDEHDARVMILGTSERYHSFIVDDVIDEREVIMRNLNPELAHVSNISHTTVLGDGQVVLILNVSDLIKNAQGKGLRHRQTTRRPARAGAPQLAKHILVVDDSITTRTLQRNILEAAGYHVQIATHGIEALDKLETETFDLIITDIEMPVMDGFELTRRIRQNPNLGNLPIILVTSLDSQDNKERGFQAGADAYVVKGVFDQNELLEMIKTLL